MSTPLKTLLFLLGFFVSYSASAQSPISDYNSSKTYSTGALVLVGAESYVMGGSGTSTNQAPASNPSVWTNLSDDALKRAEPTESVPSSAPDISSLPGADPPGSDGNSSTSIRLYGISTNSLVTPSAMMVAGVDVKGGTKKVVFQVQANGTYPNQGYITNPILYVTNSVGNVIATVDDWASGPSSFDGTYYQASFLSELTSSKFAMKGSKESAIVLNLPEGSYTALVGSNGESAKAVVAAFEFDSTSVGYLNGISTNATVTPSAMMVAGVQVTGGTKKVVFQVQANGTYPNQGYLTNPILYITNSAGTVIATVDDWGTGPSSFDATYYQASYLAELTSSKFAMKGSKESAIVLNLPEGSYTALVGSNGETAKAVVAAFAFE